jgi:hypothetical protein
METLFPSGRAIKPSTSVTRTFLGPRPLLHVVHGPAHLGLKVHPHGAVAGRVDVGHVGRGQLGLAAARSR